MPSGQRGLAKEVAERGSERGEGKPHGKGAHGGKGREEVERALQRGCRRLGPPAHGCPPASTSPTQGMGPFAETRGPELWSERLHRAPCPPPPAAGLHAGAGPGPSDSDRPSPSSTRRLISPSAHPLADGFLGRRDQRCNPGRVEGRGPRNWTSRTFARPQKVFRLGIGPRQVRIPHPCTRVWGTREETPQGRRNGTLSRRSDSVLCGPAVARPAKLSGPVPWLRRGVGTASTSWGRWEVRETERSAF